MTLAPPYPGTTQAISSSVAPRFPIIWGRATLTIEVSISSITEARMTVIVISHLLAPCWGICAFLFFLGRSVEVDGDVDVHPHPQRMAGVRRLGEHDLHRDALDDLGEVAGGVVGRQQ